MFVRITVNDRTSRERPVDIVARSTVAAFVICTALLGCGGGGGDAAERCERVRDHLVELAASGGDALPLDREDRATIVRRAMGDEFLTSCTSSMSEAHASCLLSATDSRQAARCSVPRTHQSLEVARGR
jgi:hypothetical protein